MYLIISPTIYHSVMFAMTNKPMDLANFQLNLSDINLTAENHYLTAEHTWKTEPKFSCTILNMIFQQ